MKLDTALAAPTPAVAIGSKAAPPPAKAPVTPATGIGESKLISCQGTVFPKHEDMFYSS